ncbi:MAG: sigma-54 dependent transcriptional regulator [Planctomycetota bacterium]|nr:sigma-54 dependent transcriptional regulator [Planctomycetota bacterium]
MRVLLVDDERSIRLTLGDALEEHGHRVVRCENLAQGREALDQAVLDCIITDLRLPDGSGLDLLPLARARNPAAALLVITAHQTVETAIQATKAGAEYIVKPFLNEEVLARLQKTEEVLRLKAELAELKTQVSGRYKVDRIVGKTPKMRELFNIIETIGPSDASVLITGESGTGKELVALALHRNSPRISKPLIKFSCAALPENLLEDELFGHEKGAFTDAKERKPGRFELADGGSIFLDDIDDMNVATQVKLLRVLQEREFERIGGTKTIKVDVRVITACKVDLSLLVRQGSFRDDLYFRLRVLELHLPPLRERLADVPLLVQHFIQSHGGGRSYRVASSTVQRMGEYDWPGNVRELENAVLRAIAMAGSSDMLDERYLLLTPAGLRVNEPPGLPPGAVLPQAPAAGLSVGREPPAGALAAGPAPAAVPEPPDGFRPLREIAADAERDYIKRVLASTGGNKTRAAVLLGISRKNLWEKMRDLGLL